MNRVTISRSAQTGSLVSLAVAALLALVVAAPAGATAQPACRKADVQSVASGTIAVAKQSFRGGELGSAGAWSCQFRLYDDNDENDPEVPHVFTADDWFLGGIFEWVSGSEMETLGFDHAAAVAYLDSIQERLFWREQGAEWVELPLSQTSRRSVLAPWGEVLSVVQHRYHIFAAGSLEPGVYEWRWEVDDPLSPPPGTAFGEVHILDE